MSLPRSIGIAVISMLYISTVSGETILQLTDLHHDPSYAVGSYASCFLGGSLKCCRKGMLGEKPYRKAGVWGDFQCDTPISLIEYGVSKAPDADLVIWNGDTDSHHLLSQSFDENMASVENVTEIIRQRFGSKVIPVIGNHDTWPVDQLSMPDSSNKTKLTTTLLSYWKDWIPQSEWDNFLRGGYYRYDWGNRVLLVLNCLYEDAYNFLIMGHDDPGSQYRWLEDQLSLAQNAGQKVWLIGHIPPGNSEAHKIFNSAMWKYVVEFADTIETQMWTHVHTERFLLYYNAGGAVISSAFVSASFMPDNHLPVIRTYDFDTTVGITNYQTLSLNITEMNGIGSNATEGYQLVYDAKMEYGLKNMSAISWDGLLHRLITNETTLETYWRNYAPGRSLAGSCDSDCKKQFLCQITHIGDQNPLQCD